MAKLFNQTTLTGIGSLVIAIVPYFQSGAQMNVTTWILVIVGVSLVLLGVFRKELSFADKQVIVKQREEFIPVFRDTIDEMLARIRELAKEAGNLPLELYYDRYLKLNNTFQREYFKLNHNDKDLRRKIAIVSALRKRGVWNKNTYLYELEDKDPKMTELKAKYSNLLARLNDKTQSSNLKTLFKQANLMNSVYSLIEVAKKNNFPFKDVKFINPLYETPEKIDAWINHLHKDVNNRFQSLLKGGDL